MKYIYKFLFVMLLVFSANLIASGDNKYETIEANLLAGLNSDNEGLQLSCAYFLGEIKSDKAIIPLLKILKSGESDESRIVAALSLSKIKSEIGMFAVKRRIIFDDSERVQRMCNIFYNSYMQTGVDGYHEVESTQIADLDIEFNGIKLAAFSK